MVKCVASSETNSTFRPVSDIPPTATDFSTASRRSDAKLSKSTAPVPPACAPIRSRMVDCSEGVRSSSRFDRSVFARPDSIVPTLWRLVVFVAPAVSTTGTTRASSWTVVSGSCEMRVSAIADLHEPVPAPLECQDVSHR